MSSRDKRPEEIMEETMREIFDDLNSSDTFKGMDDKDEIPNEKSSGKKSSAKASVDKKESKKKPSEGSQKKEDKPRRKSIDSTGVSPDGDLSGADSVEGADEDLEDDNADDGFADEDVADDDFEDDGTDEDLEDDDTDSTDGYEEDKMSETGKKRGKKKKNGAKIAAISIGSVLGILLIAYVGMSVYFNSHFMFYTEINGTDCSMKSVSEVEDEMKKKVSDYELTLMGSGGGTEKIAGADISLEYVPGKKVKEIIEEQNGFLWPKSLWEHTKIETEIGVSYDEAALAEQIAALACMNPETQTASVDAHPEFQEGQFGVAPEIIGTQINGEVFNAKVAEAISGFLPSLDLSEAGCYMPPRFVSDSAEVTAAVAAMNSYLGANVTYDFNPHTEVVDASVISQWVRVDGEMNVAFDEEAVRAYVQALADKYNTKGVPRQFTTATGNVVTVEGGGFGWRIDQETEFAALLANIQNAETVTREPAYVSRGISHEGNDVGSTYAEVDLTNQRMYFIQNGQVVLQSDCVTGNPNKGHATPQGVYTMDWKQRNRTLRGEKRPDGTYEYETPVAFWMPFNGGIGFHDATWQSAFGGQRYRTHGSHGCVNLPYSVAQQLFSLMYEGIPVVCHY